MLKTVVLLLIAVETDTYSVKLRGNATQSSVFEYYRADQAIDGIKYALGVASFCTHSRKQMNPWWRLDLLDNYHIRTVTITNRADCCPERLNNAEIRIGNSLENNSNNNPIVRWIIRASHSYSCPDMEGRYVNIVIPGDGRILTVCEVEVYRAPTRCPRWENIAIKGKAVQSSTFYFQAKNAIDNFDPTCTHTKNEMNPWWRLDLVDLQIIREVIVTNRMDCCFEQINGAEIRIGNSLENNGNNNPVCAVISGIPAGKSVSYSCGGMQGRYVNVVITGDSKNLSLCEVRVNGNGNF
uniref:Fucolectin tachylectin-4 pentraxin-1 domain-containing protein n=1 Tax=Sinocyclocheilus rhinocerous TaxID=307959 RepID=A0A673FXE6_9TELE